MVADNRVVNSSVHKAAFFIFPNARFISGFSGLAYAGLGKPDEYDTQKYIIKTLPESGPPDFNSKKTILRFAERITDTFKNHPRIKILPSGVKRLSIMLTGYTDNTNPPKPHFALVTNHINWDTRDDSPVAWNSFESFFRPREESEVTSLVIPIGAYTGVNRASLEELQEMLIAKKKLINIKGRAIALVRQVADMPESKNYIGKDLTVISVDRDMGPVPEMMFQPFNDTPIAEYPPIVDMLTGNAISMGLEVENVMQTRRRIRQPCSCGSRRERANCCGRFR